MGKKFVLTTQILKVMEEIYNNPGINITELRKKLGLSPSTMNVIVKHLKRWGLIEVKYVIKDLEIKRKGKMIKMKRKLKVIYPKIVACTKTGIIVIPVLFKSNNSGEYKVGVQVYNCPYVNECPYVNKYTLVPGKCKLYDELSEEDKKRINDIIDKLYTIIYVHEEQKKEEKK